MKNYVIGVSLVCFGIVVFRALESKFIESTSPEAVAWTDKSVRDAANDSAAVPAAENQGFITARVACGCVNVPADYRILNDVNTEDDRVLGFIRSPSHPWSIRLSCAFGEMGLPRERDNTKRIRQWTETFQGNEVTFMILEIDGSRSVYA